MACDLDQIGLKSHRLIYFYTITCFKQQFETRYIACNVLSYILVMNDLTDLQRLQLDINSIKNT